LVALVDDAEARARWQRAAEGRLQAGGDSLLSHIGGRTQRAGTVPAACTEEDDGAAETGETGAETIGQVPCVFLWLSGESEAKVLGRDSRVLVEHGDVVRERVAARLLPDDRVILSPGT